MQFVLKGSPEHEALIAAEQAYLDGLTADDARSLIDYTKRAGHTAAAAEMAYDEAQAASGGHKSSAVGDAKHYAQTTSEDHSMLRAFIEWKLNATPMRAHSGVGTFDWPADIVAEIVRDALKMNELEKAMERDAKDPARRAAKRADWEQYYARVEKLAAKSARNRAAYKPRPKPTIGTMHERAVKEVETRRAKLGPNPKEAVLVSLASAERKVLKFAALAERYGRDTIYVTKLEHRKRVADEAAADEGLKVP
jgi:hypothetical protein